MRPRRLWAYPSTFPCQSLPSQIRRFWRPHTRQSDRTQSGISLLKQPPDTRAFRALCRCSSSAWARRRSERSSVTSRTMHVSIGLTDIYCGPESMQPALQLRHTLRERIASPRLEGLLISIVDLADRVPMRDVVAAHGARLTIGPDEISGGSRRLIRVRAPWRDGPCQLRISLENLPHLLWSGISGRLAQRWVVASAHFGSLFD